jgi:hypothetical protein
MLGNVTDDVTAWSTLGLAVATLVVVIIALQQARLTREAVAAAQADSREAIKARIDQRAPHVTFVIRSAAFATVGWSEDVVAGAPVDQPLDVVASLGCWVHAVNEGRSRALVFLPPGSVVAGSEDSIPTSAAAKPSEPPPERSITLGPGEDCRVLVEVSRPIAEWIDTAKAARGHRPPLTEENLNVSDTFNEGIIDTTLLEFRGCPVRMQGDVAVWGGGHPYEVTLSLTNRNYAFEESVQARRSWWTRSRRVPPRQSD